MTTEEIRSRTVHTSPAEVSSALGISLGTVAVLDAVRRRPDGATAAKLAEIAGLSARHARRCLRSLEERGVCEHVRAVVYDGYGLAEPLVWKLTYSQDCFAVLGQMHPLRGQQRASCAEDLSLVPRRFWHLFWSGARGEDIRLPEHASYAASRMIGSRDVSAEAWALLNLPTEALLSVRGSSGHSADSAHLLEYELAARAQERHAE